jgi:DNA-binding winged helix-turn-helix (wHTH) protein
VLGEGAIETVVGRGYRFLLDVEAERPATNETKQLEANPIAANLAGRSGEMGAL